MACTLGVRGDEIKLKDGSKIVGTIVGFEDNAFRVKTSYGFALVQKDQVVSISVLEDEKKPDSDKAADPPAKAAASEPVVAPSLERHESANAAPTVTAKQPNAPVSGINSTFADAKPASSAASNSAASLRTSPNKPAVSATPKPLPNAMGSLSTSNAPSATASSVKGAVPTSSATAPATTAGAAAAPSSTALAVTAAPKDADADSVKEEVSGNTYTNRTWGFQMYKPPEWQVISGARSMLPGAITAMGTSDQKTYLLIGQEVAGKSLTSDMDAIESRLREVLDNYRSLGEKRITVSGLSAIQHKFRGTIDNHDWSGVVVFIPRDTHLYTIFGMTYADSDLVQIQENIIARAISSVQFTKQ